MLTTTRIGIDLGGTKIEAIAMDARGQIVLRQRAPTPSDDYQGILGTIKDLVFGLETELGTRASVGVATPGALSPATGCIKNSNSQCLNGQPLAQDLERCLGRPVRLANDADCFALSEATDGAAEGARSVFGVIVGTGTGGGIVVNERLLAGPNAIAGEWGHNPLPWPQGDELPGPPCYCGKKGCIETFLSGPGLAQDHQRRANVTITAKEIAASAADGEADAIATMERYVDRLARALAGIINVLDPEVIVLGGGLSQIHCLYEQVPGCWGNYVFSDRVDTRLVQAKHGDSSGVRGAAWLWPQQILD
ncbi:MAG: ROK family protein [Gammaproteobacteria bacterium]